MTKKYKPNLDHLDQLNVAVGNLDILLENITKDVKGFKELNLFIHGSYLNKVKLSETNKWAQAHYGLTHGFCEIMLRLRTKRHCLADDIEADIAKIRISRLPGNCSVGIIHGLWIGEAHRKRGLGRSFVKLALDFAKVLDYSLLMCSVRKINTPALNIAHGWEMKRTTDFVSARTGNNVNVYFKNINPNDKSLTKIYEQKKAQYVEEEGGCG